MKPSFMIRFGGIFIRSAMALALAAGLLVPAVSAKAADGPVCYVDIDAGAGGDGNAWGTAYDDLQAALGDASCTEIWVAEGLYLPGALETDSFFVDPGVAVYGGFAGTETLRTQRDWISNVTVLSGDLQGDDTTDINGVVEDDSHIVGDNSDHIIWLIGATAATIVDGFTITGGQADGLVIPEYNGAAIYCPDECDVTVANVVFSGNTAGYGAGFYNRSTGGVVSTPSFTGVTFTGGYVTAQGGGIFVEAHVATVNVTLSDATFSNNHAESSGGGFFSSAGNIGTANPVLTDVVFSGNSAYFNGGAMVLATGGGDGDATLDRVTFTGNSVTWSGGALYNAAGSNASGTANATVTNAVFSGNSSLNDGGAVFNHADGSATAAPQFINVTFYDNSADRGGAVFNHDSDNTGVANPGVHNSIFWGNTAGTSGPNWGNLGTNATGSIEYSDVQGYCAATGATCGSGNIMTDPLFLDAPLGDLRIANNSLVIDAGINSQVPVGVIYDHDGLDRFIDNPLTVDIGTGTAPIVDMGAYENQLACPAGSQLYVDQDATGIGDGTTWADAFVDLQDALAVTGACSGGDIWVAEGVYKPGAGQSDAFDVAAGTGLYGGFAGTETLLSERDWFYHPTILSADIGGDDDSNNADGNYINETYADIVGTNNYTLLFLTDSSAAITASTVVDGFTVTGADGTLGGGLWCNGYQTICSPTLQNLVFRGNRAQVGGAIMNFGDDGESSPAIVNVSFIGNHATDSGGAVYNDGVSTGDSSPTFTNVTFEGNSAVNGGGAVFNNGGNSGTSNPVFRNVTFNSNSATNGGALYNEATSGASAPAFTNVILWGDSADAGDEMFNSLGSPGIDFTIVQGGDAGIAGSSAFSAGAANLDADPMFGPLGDYGGALTMSIGATSAALDTGDGPTCAAAPVNGLDQRGVTRPQGPECDMGAYELIVTDTVGIANFGTFYLRDSNTPGQADYTFPFGWAGPTALVGDWDGDGAATAGIFSSGTFFLSNSNSAGPADATFSFGWAGATPLVGDWDGDGIDTIGIHSGGWFFLRNSNTPGPADIVFSFGWDGPTPVVGDWDADGVDTIGIHDSGWFFLRNSNSAGAADLTFQYGWAGPMPIIGDWDGDGMDSIGLDADGAFFLRNQNSPGPGDVTFNFGWAGASPLAGTWDLLP